MTASTSLSITPRWPGTVETFVSAAAFFDFDLVAHSGDGLWIWTDEDDSRGRKRSGKSLAFRQKAIAWMDGLSAALLARVNNLFDDKVAFGCRRGPYSNCDICHLDVQGILVGLRINGDRFNSHLARGLDDPAGNFTAIGNENTLEHSVLGPRRRLFGLRRYGGKVNRVPKAKRTKSLSKM